MTKMSILALAGFVAVVGCSKKNNTNATTTTSDTTTVTQPAPATTDTVVTTTTTATDTIHANPSDTTKKDTTKAAKEHMKAKEHKK